MRFLIVLIAMTVSVASSVGVAAQEYDAGVHYVVLEQPVRVSNPLRIEVAEVFSYRSSHSFYLEPILQAWKKKQGDDVALLQIHPGMNPQMELAARGYYAIKALKLRDTAHMDVFKAIFIEKRPLDTPEQWAEFLAAYGADRERILMTLGSYGVTSQLQQANARARAYGLTGIPEMVVAGTYRVSSAKVGGVVEMLNVVDYLVRRERAAR